MDVLEAMKKEMFRRGLSHRTMTTYLFYVRKFLIFCRKEPKEFSKKDCREFLLKFMDKGVSMNSLNVALNALRFMMEEILHKRMRLNIRYSKTPKQMPICLTKEEVRLLLAAIKNPKHWLLVALIYGAGLRVSEAVKLRPRDIDVDARVGWVRRGKGNKDRPFIIPDCLKEALAEREGTYVFPGNKGLHLSARTVQEVLRKAREIAEIEKPIHPHTLRHSFATHLVEAGYDITSVQALLGHSEARTTMIYLHTAKPKLFSVRSPLDSL